MSSASSTSLASGRALRLTWPFGRTVVLALLLLALAAGAAEGLARVPAVRERLAFISTDNPNQEFDSLLYLLDQRVAAAGALDCLIIGSSHVAFGFSPEEFAAAYRQSGAGEPPDCFNFAVSGLVALQAGPLARLLVARYHPRLLIFTTSARDFSPHLAALGYTPETDFARGAWFRYALGEDFSVEGWLIEHSSAYRALISLRRWLQTPPASRTPRLLIDLSTPPDPVVESDLFAILADYQFSPAGLAGLDQVLALQGPGVAVYVVEMPLHPTYALAFSNGPADLDRFRAEVQQRTLAAGAVFWSAHLELTPTLADSDFVDRHHLSPTGRQAFSAWLAGKLAGAR